MLIKDHCNKLNEVLNLGEEAKTERAMKEARKIISSPGKASIDKLRNAVLVAGGAGVSLGAILYKIAAALEHGAIAMSSSLGCTRTETTPGGWFSGATTRTVHSTSGACYFSASASALDALSTGLELAFSGMGGVVNLATPSVIFAIIVVAFVFILVAMVGIRLPLSGFGNRDTSHFNIAISAAIAPTTGARYRGRTTFVSTLRNERPVLLVHTNPEEQFYASPGRCRPWSYLQETQPVQQIDILREVPYPMPYPVVAGPSVQVPIDRIVDKEVVARCGSSRTQNGIPCRNLVTTPGDSCHLH